jgi:hypothetical protein
MNNEKFFVLLGVSSRQYSGVRRKLLTPQKRLNFLLFALRVFALVGV